MLIRQPCATSYLLPPEKVVTSEFGSVRSDLENHLVMDRFRDQGGAYVDAASPAGRDALGRATTDRCQGAAGGPGNDRCTALRPRAAASDRRSLASRDGRDRAGCAHRGSPDDPDRDLRAADGDQAAKRLGLRDPYQGGLRLAAPAPLLPYLPPLPGARGVDDQKADPADRIPDGGGADPGADCQGAEGAALSPPGRPDRLHRGGGRRPLPDPTRGWPPTG